MAWGGWLMRPSIEPTMWRASRMLVAVCESCHAWVKGSVGLTNILNILQYTTLSGACQAVFSLFFSASASSVPITFCVFWLTNLFVAHEWLTNLFNDHYSRILIDKSITLFNRLFRGYLFWRISLFLWTILFNIFLYERNFASGKSPILRNYKMILFSWHENCGGAQP